MSYISLGVFLVVSSQLNIGCVRAARLVCSSYAVLSSHSHALQSYRVQGGPAYLKPYQRLPMMLAYRVFFCLWSCSLYFLLINIIGRRILHWTGLILSVFLSVWFFVVRWKWLARTHHRCIYLLPLKSMGDAKVSCCLPLRTITNLLLLLNDMSLL